MFIVIRFWMQPNILASIIAGVGAGAILNSFHEKFEIGKTSSRIIVVAYVATLVSLRYH